MCELYEIYDSITTYIAVVCVLQQAYAWASRRPLILILIIIISQAAAISFKIDFDRLKNILLQFAYVEKISHNPLVAAHV